MVWEQSYTITVPEINIVTKMRVRLPFAPQQTQYNTDNSNNQT